MLWDGLRNIDVGTYCSYHWKSYCEFIPAEKHIQSKAQTFTIEGYNSRIRHYLVRFKRKGKCYSKAVHYDRKILETTISKT